MTETCVQCPKCEKWIQRRTFLRKHMLEEHASEPVEPPTSLGDTGHSPVPPPQNSDANRSSFLQSLIEGGQITATSFRQSRKRTQLYSDHHNGTGSDFEADRDAIFPKS